MGRTPCEDCTICPLRVSTDCGQYFAAFEYFSPGHVAESTFFIAIRYVYFTRNPAGTSMYFTRASKLGKSFAFFAAGEIRFVVVSILSCSFGLRGKCHSLGSVFYLHLVKIVLPSGEITMTSFFVNKTLQSASQIGTTPINCW